VYRDAANVRGSSGHGIAVFSRRTLITLAPVTCPVSLAEIILLPVSAAHAKPQHMELNDWNSPTTKLLTLLNVSSAKSLKRKFLDQQGSPPHKLNKRRVPDRVSPNSAVEVNTDVEITEPEADGAGQDNSPADVGTSEAADLSDTEGVIHLWLSKCLSDYKMRKSLRMSSISGLHHPA